jgi:hypothetical protein
VFDAVTHPQKRAFLEAYSLTGSVKFAAHAAKVKRSNHYDWKANDPAYAEAFALAETMAADALVDEAKRRAQFGVKDFILYQGQIVTREVVDADGVVTRVPLMKRKYSDSLLQFLLEGLKPDTFHERREIAHSAPDGLKVDVEVKHALDLSGLSEDELTALERIASKLGVGGGA